MIIPPWNWSSAAKDFQEADAYLVSIPKCGRTWMRVFLGAYFEKAGGTTLKVKHTHDLWDHRTKSRWYEQIRGKRLIPSSDRRSKPVLLVVRDPRDLLVSLYFHLTRRTKEFEGTVSELVHSPMFGIEAIVEVWNYWLREWANHPKFMCLSYEAARSETARTFGQAVEFLSGRPPDSAAMEYALEQSSFENMRKMETSGEGAAGKVAGVDVAALTPGSLEDPGSYKVRSGKVGGYTEHLSEEDLAYISRVLERLDDRLSYRTTK